MAELAEGARLLSDFRASEPAWIKGLRSLCFCGFAGNFSISITGSDIDRQEAFRAPVPFQRRAEEVQTHHIQQDVPDAVVDELIGDQGPELQDHAKTHTLQCEKRPDGPWCAEIEVDAAGAIQRGEDEDGEVDVNNFKAITRDEYIAQLTADNDDAVEELQSKEDDGLNAFEAAAAKKASCKR